jgi:hypothetical protein
MAEVFGITAGALSVAGLFNNAVDCFEYIQLGRNFGTDYQTCQLRLDIARLRLSRWGCAVNINNEARFADVNPSSDEVLMAKNTLEQLLNLFSAAHKQSSNFKLTAMEDDLALFDPSTNTNQAIIALRNTMHELARRRQKRTSLSKKISWALYKQKYFTRLIDDIQELLDGLENIFPQREAYKRLVEVEVEEVKDETSMQVLSEASAETDALLRTAAIQRLEGIGSSNIVEKAKVSDSAKVKVGNEYISQTVLSSRDRAATMNKVGDLEAKGNSKTFVGDSFGGTQFLGS